MTTNDGVSSWFEVEAVEIPAEIPQFLAEATFETMEGMINLLQDKNEAMKAEIEESRGKVEEIGRASDFLETEWDDLAEDTHLLKHKDDHPSGLVRLREKYRARKKK